MILRRWDWLRQTGRAKVSTHTQVLVCVVGVTRKGYLTDSAQRTTIFVSPGPPASAASAHAEQISMA